MNLEWSTDAFLAAVGCADEPRPRKRWAGQNDWDAENMVTESTRFTVENDARLRRLCREAGVTRYYLISYMLHTWMAAREERERRGTERADHPGGGCTNPPGPV